MRFLVSCDRFRVRVLAGGLWLAVIVAPWLMTAALGSESQPRVEPLNFVVVVCDNLGYGDTEPFGSTVHRTPNLNRMAREGRRFTHFYASAGVCTASRASLMTGCYPQRVGMHTNPRDGWVLRPLSPYGLHPDEVTLAEVLKERGYATAIIGKWHLGDQPEFLPTRQGFDRFFGVPYSDDMTERTWTDGSQWPPLPLMENETVIEAPCDRGQLTRRYTDEAIRWIREQREKPFFLYLPHAMPGSTQTPFASEAFRGRSENGAWGDAVEELDWSLGRILDELETLEIAERTLVIWTSDNGAPIRADLNDVSRGSNRPLHGRGYSTSEGAFRVPMIAWQPGQVPGGTTCATLATMMDLLPTAARLTGQDLRPEHRIDGHDITSLLYEDQHPKSPYEAFFYYHQDQLQAVRAGPWKLFLPVYDDRHPHFAGPESVEPLLFDVVADVACQHNVAARHPDVVDRLSELANSARKDLGDRGRPGSGQRKPGVITGVPQPQRLPPPAALDLIEQERGGRHWVDAGTAPPRSPAESLACLQIEPGFEVELVAAEPIVRDPVAIAFDHRGRMFVAEYADYPVGPPAGDPPLSRVVLVEDTDADGVADRRQVFADRLDFANSLMAFDGGLLVAAKTQILLLKDTDGDDVADSREVLFDGFTPAHPQMQISNPRWGIDNWIYCNYAPGKVSSSRQPDRRVDLPRNDFRFHPRTLEFEPVSGWGQYGNTIDRWGQRFYCTNRNPIITNHLPLSAVRRNPFAVITRSFYDVGKAGGETRVYPLVEMQSNYLSHAGTHTAACGVTAYRGDLFAGDGQRSLFVCEPIGHLVTRSIVESDGLRLRARRARVQADFLASTDRWFRPVSGATGPDGGLYIADMYRLWVEHPKFLPPEVAARLDWRAGEDRGRIYRIVPEGVTARPFRTPPRWEEWVELLEDPNAWRQFLGQRWLVERQDQRAVPMLRELLARSRRATTRLHALWTLAGLQSLQQTDILTALDDSHAIVRRDAVRLASASSQDTVIFAKLAERARDDDPRVRFQVAVALGDIDRNQATTLLTELAARDGHDEWFAAGILTSVRERAGAILIGLVDRSAHPIEGGELELLRALADVVGARGDTAELTAVMQRVASDQPTGLGWRAAVLRGLGGGLARHRGSLGRVTLADLLSQPPESLAGPAASSPPTHRRIRIHDAGRNAAGRRPRRKSAAVSISAQ